MNLDYYEGRKLCAVFVKVLDEAAGKVQLHTWHGRGDVENRKLSIVKPDGAKFTIPHTALANILANDGTDVLEDCEYYVLIKVDSEISFEKPDYMD